MALRTVLLLGATFTLLTVPVMAAGAAGRQPVPAATVETTVDALVARFGRAQEARIRQGVAQAAQRWWPEDGGAAVFSAFCRDSFIADPAELSAAFARLERVSEQMDGHLFIIRRELLTPQDLDTGPLSKVDTLLVGIDPAAHETDDLFANKVAFFALLNFPVHTLSERLSAGASWDRETWARSRMMDRFAERVPAAVQQDVTRALTDADGYIAGYNIRMDHLVTRDGRRLFAEGLRLNSHWGLRDELASHYGEADGLVKQRMIEKVMERIVRQEIPAAVIDNPGLDWCPETNQVRLATGAKAEAGAPLGAREPDTRYARWIENFHALREMDPYCPEAPTAIARSFDRDRQIPEKQVEALIVSVLSSPEFKGVAGLVRERLGRPLEPFDIWYSGFKPRAGHSEEELDRIVGARYPDVAAFQADLPRILRDLGFSPERASWVAGQIVVDPSRGSGHAMGAVLRGDKAHLRTRVPTGGMNYKGYNIGIHEFGHTVEETFSLQAIDHWFLNGVPDNAFTEALAMIFQAHDLELLGLGNRGAASRREDALGTLWATAEIGAVSLVDMKAWDWLYAHPAATPAELREAVLAAAREVWNAYFAPVFGVKDSEILAIYSHMVDYPLYLSDYAIGHVIAFQLDERLERGNFGAEFERMARQGRLTPDLWMKGAVGQPISADALLAAARQALAERPTP